ncbi:hypothetical protein B0H13DRAFT_2317729 [Mycena leptocephala]|nr:hypothetical protein B0H13DRAFT_2317729 [Mycena leptocephala]
MDRLARLIDGTVSTAFCARIIGPRSNSAVVNPSPRFRSEIMPRLADAVTQAAERARSVRPSDFFSCAADTLSRLGAEINGELREVFADGRGRANEDAEIRHWVDLQKTFKADLQTLRDLELSHQLQTISRAPGVIPLPTAPVLRPTVYSVTAQGVWIRSSVEH